MLDRRRFTHGLLGAAAAALALPKTALAQTALSPTSPGATPAAPDPAAIAAQIRGRSYGPLLERARAALAAHHDQFRLRDRIALADFTRPSRELRFHIVDLIDGTGNSYLVAHGKGSDPDHSGWLQSFSNLPDSLATSQGAYRTGEIYDGIHGQSMRLVGLDPSNDQAEARAIVIHGADYVGENHIATWGKCGRSEGCFAVAPHMLPQILAMLGPGRLLYADKLTA